MELTGHISSQRFAKWLITSKENLALLVISGLIIIITFVYLKTIYRIPNFFPDSYEYISSAIQYTGIFTRPIGYVKFLQVFRFFTHSHLTLILFQYIFIQASLVYLLFTISYLLNPSKFLFRILVVSSALNPLIFHFSNLIGSDALFTALSLLWLTQLIWIIVLPSSKTLVIHAIILFLAFTIRYNAIYYPLISVGFILFCKTKWRYKIICIATIVILIGWYILLTKHQFKKNSGISQLAPFSGWQLAANALAAYAHVSKLDEPNIVPAKFRELHTIVNSYMELTSETRHASTIQSVIYYLWMNNSPLYQYMLKVWAKKKQANKLTQWSMMAPLYSAYGQYIIKKHTSLYLKYYLIPNAKEYFKPFTEYVGMYNVAGKKILPSAIYWFELKPNECESDLNAKDINSIKFSSTFNAAINLMLILGFICFIVQGGHKKIDPLCNRILLCILSIWLLNIGFSVIASPISLRFQVFQLLTTFIFSLVLVEINIRIFMKGHGLKKQTKVNTLLV